MPHTPVQGFPGEVPVLLQRAFEMAERKGITVQLLADELRWPADLVLKLLAQDPRPDLYLGAVPSEAKQPSAGDRDRHRGSRAPMPEAAVLGYAFLTTSCTIRIVAGQGLAGPWGLSPLTCIDEESGSYVHEVVRVVP